MKTKTKAPKKKPPKRTYAKGDKAGEAVSSTRILRGSKKRPATEYVSSNYADSQVFPFNPDDLASSNIYDIYDEMRDDDQVKAALITKKQLVVSSGFEIDTENEDVKDFLETELKNLNVDNQGLDPGFDEAVKDMLSCYDFGFSITEPVFDIKVGGKYDGLWGIKCMKTRPPHTFYFHIDDFGNVKRIEQRTQNGTKDFKPGRFIHMAYQSDFGNPYGKSDLKAAHNPWRTKKFLDKFYPMALEKYAAPLIVGRYEDGTDPNEIQELHNIIKNVQVTTGITLPKDVELEIIEAARDGSVSFENAINHYNLRIARAILVPDLIGMSGSKTGGGSFALGDKQFSLFMEMAHSMRKSLSRTINSQLVRPLVAVNFGEAEAEKVEFKWLPFKEELLVDNYRVWVEAVTKMRIKPTPEQINHVSKALGIPEADTVEFVPEPTPAMPGQAGKKPPGQEGSNGENKGKAKVNNAKEDFGFNRPKTVYENKMDFGSIIGALDASEEELIPELEAITSKMQKDYIDRIRNSSILKRNDVNRLNKVEFKFQKELNRSWARHFEGLFDAASAEARKEILPRGTFEGEATMLPEEFLTVLAAESFKIVGDYTARTTSIARSTIIQGIKDGLGEGQIFEMVRDEMSGESARWIRTVVRTKTTEVYNEARKLYYETDPIAKQIVVAYQWSAIRDTRTSAICTRLDRRIWKIGEFTNRIKPPAHYNCRSILIPITKFEDFKESSKPSDFVMRKLGGNLLSLPGAPKKGKFAHGTGDLIPASGEADMFGDTGIIAPPGEGKSIVLYGLLVSNPSNDFPVTAGIRSDLDTEIKFKKTLDRSGGSLEKDWADGYQLPTGEGLYLNLSGPIRVNWTVEYQVVDS